MSPDPTAPAPSTAPDAPEAPKKARPLEKRPAETPPPAPVAPPTPYGAPQGPPPQGYPPQSFPPPYSHYGYPRQGHQANPPYGYPPPHAQPMYVPAPGQDTFAGLRYLKYGVGLMAVFNAFALFANLLLYAALGQIRSLATNPSMATLAAADITNNVATIFALLSFVFGFIGMIVGLVGVGFVARGKAEFGPDHSRAVNRGVILAAVTCFLYLGAFIVTFIMNASVSSALEITSATSLSSGLEEMARGIIIASILSLFAGVAAYLAMTSLVEETMTRRGMNQRSSFLVLSLAGPVMFLVVALLVPGWLSSANNSMPLTAQATLVWLSALLAPLQWMTLASVLEAFLAILALAVYNGMVNAAADGARNMIASGQYDPDARPTASGSPPMAPAGMPGPQPPY